MASDQGGKAEHSRGFSFPVHRRVQSAKQVSRTSSSLLTVKDGRHRAGPSRQVDMSQLPPPPPPPAAS